MPVSSETLDETLQAFRRAKAQMALAAIRSQASASGADRLSLRAIDKIVAEVRQRRGRQRRATGR